jgi:hypothetical protein
MLLLLSICIINEFIPSSVFEKKGGITFESDEDISWCCTSLVKAPARTAAV